MRKLCFFLVLSLFEWNSVLGYFPYDRHRDYVNKDSPQMRTLRAPPTRADDLYKLVAKADRAVLAAQPALANRYRTGVMLTQRSELAANRALVEAHMAVFAANRSVPECGDNKKCIKCVNSCQYINRSLSGDTMIENFYRMVCAIGCRRQT